MKRGRLENAINNSVLIRIAGTNSEQQEKQRFE